MGSMTLGKRITLGFGIVIVIMLALGTMAMLNMNGAAKNSFALAEKYAPEVDVATRTERNVMKLMYEIRGYSFTGEEKFLNNGLTYLKNAKERTNDMKELAAKYPELVKLKESVGKIESSVNEYERLIAQTKVAYDKQDKAREAMNANAGEFIKNINDYLEAITKQSLQQIKDKVPVEAMERRIEMITLANEVIDLGNAIRIANFRAQALRDFSGVKDVMKNFDGINSKIDELLKETKLDINKARLENTKKAAQGYKEAVQTFLNIAAELDKLMYERMKTGDEALKEGEIISRAGVKQTTDLSNVSNSELTSASTIMVIGLVVATILAIAIAAFIILSTTRAISTAVKSIIEANDQVVSASNEIADSSTSLAEGASRQASSVEEVSATIEESTSINTQNAQNSREADILAKQTKEAAEDGYKKGNELMVAMNEINHSSEKISKIIKTIDEIASQTKLLALNAAVEAARAGEHGLGFAVVADEVKSLAQRSADAATETANIIEESISQAKKGSQISKETSEAFNNILDKIKKTSNLIGEISISAKEQSEGMNQIALAMGEIDQITQQNAATSEEAAAASEELNAQAISMKETVGIIARLVGYIDSASHAPVAQKSKKSSISTPAKKVQFNQPKSKLGQKQLPKKESHDDVFPLDEDDLKEF